MFHPPLKGVRSELGWYSEQTAREACANVASLIRIKAGIMESLVGVRFSVKALVYADKQAFLDGKANDADNFDAKSLKSRPLAIPPRMISTSDANTQASS